MKRLVHPDNPFQNNGSAFPYSAKVFLWEVLTDEIDRNTHKSYHLDYGANDGSMLKILSESGVISQGVGLELNKEVVLAHENELPRNVRLQITGKNATLPYPDDTFDTVSIIGVLEHIKNKHHILYELKRVMKDDGLLVVAVPGKNLFSFLDFGNLKFVFPRLHRIYFEFRFSKEQYQECYVKCKNGLIGDIETELAWHEHFSHKELSALLNECQLNVVEQDGFGYFFLILHNIRYFMPNFLKGIFDRLIYYDAKFFHRAEIFVKVKK